jgi:hypothetical protein
MKFYLGVHKYASNAAVRGECGWIKCKYDRWLTMCRYWNRLVQMNNERLTYKIFKYDLSRTKHNWSSDMKNIFNDVNMLDIFETESICTLTSVNELFVCNNNAVWKEEVNKLPKLRTYRTFKISSSRENYLSMYLTRAERALLAQFRTGILPLRIETGRYSREKEIQRICIFCNNDKIENEFHFLFECMLYDNVRKTFFKEIAITNTEFCTMNHESKINTLFDLHMRPTAQFILKCYNIRKDYLYDIC